MDYMILRSPEPAAKGVKCPPPGADDIFFYPITEHRFYQIDFYFELIYIQHIYRDTFIVDSEAVL